jgi:hypothetical protein
MRIDPPNLLISVRFAGSSARRSPFGHRIRARVIPGSPLRQATAASCAPHGTEDHSMKPQVSIDTMDLDQQIDLLIERYESAAAAADAARLEYLALRSSPQASAAAVSRRRAQWQQCERSRTALRRAIDVLEDRVGG